MFSCGALPSEFSCARTHCLSVSESALMCQNFVSEFLILTEGHDLSLKKCLYMTCLRPAAA